jgi:GNAT superfamily N-acetyltransferase
MPFATWWRGDPIPDLPLLPGFSARRITRPDESQHITGLAEHRVLLRYQNAHRLYAAFLEDQPVGYGWMAMQTGGIEELDFSFAVPPRNGYLWDFVTLPAWRGRGVYPHLLQEIVRQEAEIERFWIGYEERNEVSGRGIARAGFRVVGDLIVEGRRVTRFAVVDDGERARAAGELFELPLRHEA